MGVYFLTHMDLNDLRPENELMRFKNAHEALLAYDFGLAPTTLEIIYDMGFMGAKSSQPWPAGHSS